MCDVCCGLLTHFTSNSIPAYSLHQIKGPVVGGHQINRWQDLTVVGAVFALVPIRLASQGSVTLHSHFTRPHECFCITRFC